MRELGNNLDLIKEFGCDDFVLRQVLRQLIYFIVSISLNQLLGKILTFPVPPASKDPELPLNLCIACNQLIEILFFSTEGSLQFGKSNATALQCFSN